MLKAHPLPLLAMFFAAILALGCRPQAPAEPGLEIPLADGRHAPEVLTESRILDFPPSTGPNRFVKGWWFWRRQGQPWLKPDVAGSRIEVVNLGERPRDLVLRTEILEAPPGATVAVRVAGQDAGTFELASPLEIPLRDLPFGRFPIDLFFSEGAETALDQAGFRQALPAGEVQVARDEIAQAGDSAVDFVHRVPPGTVLRGRFEPPEDATAGQVFSLWIEEEGGAPARVFEWRAGLWSRLGGTRDLQFPLRPEGGLTRVRLVASGEGSPARWRNLSWRVPEPPPWTPPAPPGSPRLVVLYVLDALRADLVGHLGGPEGVSPHIDRLASEGATFTRHLSVAPNTLPSTKALLTGRTSRVTGGWKLTPDGPATLADLFSRAGYRTAVFSGNPYVSAEYGTVRGFDHDASPAIQSASPASYNDSAERVQSEARAWLDGLAPDDRAFVYIHSLNPHNPYEAPEPFRGRFVTTRDSSIDGSTEVLLDIKKRRRDVTEADRRRLWELYAAGLAYNDEHLGDLVREIEARYAPGEAMIVVTSDHGDEFFEHDGILHGYTLYEEQLHIPLVVWWPTRVPPGEIAAPTDSPDVHETFRELLGEPASGLGEGRSLWPRLLDGPAGTPAEKEIRFAAASSLEGGIFMARSQRYKVIWAPRKGAGWGLGEGRGRTRDPEYLYDLEADPGETVNLAGESSLEIDWLRSRLLAWVEAGKAFESGEDAEPAIDNETREKLKALGYLD